MLTLSGLTRLYVSAVETVPAVDAVDLVASTGEFLCLHGTSGSGKTTLLNLIGGLDLPTAGQVQLGATNVGSLTVGDRVTLRRDLVGMVHQDDGLIDEFTAAENVALPLEAAGTPLPVARRSAVAQLDRVGLAGLEERFPRQLSGGQRQRVGIARALVGDRRVLLADEPTGALDSRSAAVVYDLLASIAADGVLVVVASHDPACREYASRVVEIADGAIVHDSGSEPSPDQ